MSKLIVSLTPKENSIRFDPGRSDLLWFLYYSYFHSSMLSGTNRYVLDRQKKIDKAKSTAA